MSGSKRKVKSHEYDLTTLKALDLVNHYSKYARLQIDSFELTLRAALVATNPADPAVMRRAYDQMMAGLTQSVEMLVNVARGAVGDFLDKETPETGDGASGVGMNPLTPIEAVNDVVSNGAEQDNTTPTSGPEEQEPGQSLDSGQ